MQVAMLGVRPQSPASRCLNIAGVVKREDAGVKCGAAMPMNQELVRLLQSLVHVPSVNPALAGDPAVGGEARFATFLSEYLQRKGFRVDILEVTEGRPNVIGRYGALKPVHTVMIEGHLDTQGIHGMTVDPFAGEIRGNRLYGRGACDTKGPIAAALHALDPETLATLERAGIEFIFAGAVGEERGNLGAEQMVDAGIAADDALVLEPTDLRIIHAHKGTFWFEVEVRGKAAHGSQPENGCSAVLGMSLAMEVLLAQAATDAGKQCNALLGRTTTNIGVIRGGSSINIVPDRCVIEVDRRTLPGDDTRGILDRLRAAMAELQAAGHFTGFDIRLIKETPPFETAAASPMIARLRGAVTDSGIPAVCGGVGWYSDAGPLSRVAKAVAVFGPGSIAQAHTADEFIELDSLEMGAAIIRRWLLRTAEEVARR